MRRNSIFIEDILEAMDKIGRYIEGSTYETFVGNEMVIDAVIRNLEIIGEAAKNIPDDAKEKYPDIPWKRMIGLRNITIHEYFGVDLSIIWKIITENLPETRSMIKTMLKGLRKEEKR
ncbi:MAG: DUF86 domain-containing protein [Candidatus Thermoplasmatota archaeon]|nr:DUF86 domain-containing protein [Candidatus Thermoplasmatota archaeon]